MRNLPTYDDDQDGMFRPQMECKLEHLVWGYDCPRCGYAITTAAVKKLGEPKCPLGRTDRFAK